MTDQNTTITETPAKEATVVDTGAQRAACDQVVAGIRRLTGHMLHDYWSVGKLVNEVVVAQDSAEGKAKYGSNAMTYISGQTKHSVAELYRMNTVFQRYNETEINRLTDAGLGITNVVEAAKIVDSNERMKLLLSAAEKNTTVKEFKKVIDEAADSKENQKALAKERGEEKNGVKSRPGTGREGSPITPVKQLYALGEKIDASAKNSVIALKGFEPETEKQTRNMVEAAEAAVGVIADALGSLVGAAEVLEEFLAHNQGDGRRRRSQVSRKDSYAAVAGAIQDFLKGYDKTLSAGEKSRKEAEEAEAEERKKAKEAIREKADKAKKAKAEKQAEKPSKSDVARANEEASLKERLKQLRARALKAKK